MFFWNSLAFSMIQWSNLISGPSPFSKSSLNIWKFSVHVLLKPCLDNFEHYLASMWNECSCVVVWTFFSIEIKTDIFQYCGQCWVSLTHWHIEYSILTASSFRIWNSLTRIPWLSLVLFIQMLPKASHSRMSGSRRGITLLWLSCLLRSFL